LDNSSNIVHDAEQKIEIEAKEKRDGDVKKQIEDIKKKIK